MIEPGWPVAIALAALLLVALGAHRVGGYGLDRSALVAAVRALLQLMVVAIVIRAVVDAARGMGASNAQLLLLVQLPLASPVVFAGIQTATVQNIGVATLAAYIGGGGLGDLILQGMAMVDPAVLLAGAIPVAALAMTAEVLLSRLRRFVVPAGLRTELAR